MQRILVITGPTNVGKTALAIKLAQALNGEIISADSRQIYKEMSIGTAKPTAAEQRAAHHYLIDVVNPNQPFSLADYQQAAFAAIAEISKKNKLPVLVGGTGLYISAVVNGLNIPKAAPNESLRAKLESLTSQQLINKLKSLDPTSASKIPPNNKRRLIRALEVTIQLGRPFSEVSSSSHRQFDTLTVGLTAPREILYARADRGVEEWLKSGWLEEVKRLKNKYSSTLPSMSSIGYHEIGQYLDGKLTLEEAIARVKFSRHAYIRRQLTWFRRSSNINWFDTSQKDWEEQVAKLVSSWYS